MAANNWREEYEKLQTFVASRPDIQIEPGRASIPENVRPDFYRLFDAVRRRFAAEASPALFNDAMILSDNYLTAETAVKKLLSLTEIIQPPPLNWFLKDPADGLVRDLFDPLFELLSGKLDIPTFEMKFSRPVETQLKDLSRLGYEQWVTLSLIRLAFPEKLLQVSLRNPGRSEHAHILGLFETWKEDVPAPEESNVLSFDHSLDILFNNPDYIIRSRDKYLGVRSRCGQPIAAGSYVAQNREWLPIDEATLPEPGSIYVYIDETANNIGLVTDKEKICRPDMIIECIEQPDWYSGERPLAIKRQHETLKPRFGTLLVTRQPVPEAYDKDIMAALIPQSADTPENLAAAEAATGIRLLNVGLDYQALEPAIRVLLPVVPKPARQSFWQRLVAWLTGRASHQSV